MNSDSEDRLDLELKLLRNQRIEVSIVFVYLIGIILQVIALFTANRGLFNLILVLIAPVAALVWLRLADMTLDLNPSIYNRYGMGKLYTQISIFSGNKKIPFAALALSLLLLGSTFFNFVTYESASKQELKENQEAIQQITEINEQLAEANEQLSEAIQNTILKLESIQERAGSLARNNTNSSNTTGIKALHNELKSTTDILKSTLGKIKSPKLN